MATVNFNLRSQSMAKPQPISLTFRHQGLRVVYATGLKVPAKYWSTDRQRVKNVTHVPNKDKINNTLNQLETEVKRWAVDRIEGREVLTAESLRLHLDDYTGRRPGPGRDLMAYFTNYVETAPTRILETGRPPAKGTVKQQRTTLNTFIKFGKAYRRPMDFDTIDLKFYDDFIKWMQSRDAAQNTIGKHIKVLRTVLNAATLDGVNKNLTFRSRHFKVSKEDVQNIYLNRTELSQIAALDLTGNPRLDRARDLFLLGAWTGLRYSDFTQITPDNVQGGNIRMNQRKTGGAVVIPVSDELRAILDKYDGHAPPSISNQKLNKYIKEVGQLAGITTPVIQGQTRGGVKKVNRAKKWELITTHTARRSFATNAYKLGAPTLSIMQTTGHKSEAAFLKYIKVSKEEHADIMREHLKQMSKPQPLTHLKSVTA